jgi:hypothetical protein
MIATTNSRRLIASSLTGVAVAASIAALPPALLDPLVAASGLPNLMAVAAPPVGAIGRTILALAIGGTVTGFAHFATGYFPRFWRHKPAGTVGQTVVVIASDAPVLRRADAHPDAPARRPIRASEDLGPPLSLSAPPPAPTNYEQSLPADLDLPLAAFDPLALPATPAEPVRPVASLASRRALIDPGERFETFALTPPPRARRAAPANDQMSIGALLDRLERGAQRTQRGAVDVDGTLGMLRGLATG